MTRPLRGHKGGGLGRATMSLLLRSPQIQSLDQLLDQTVIGKTVLYSQSIMVINANANNFTHLSCSQWDDTMFDGTCHKRQVNVVLGNLIHLKYHGDVPLTGDASFVATCWVDYGLSLNATYGNAKKAVWSDFWVTILSPFFKVLFLMPDFGNA
jgi:hypothetical protein